MKTGNFFLFKSGSLRTKNTVSKINRKSDQTVSANVKYLMNLDTGGYGHIIGYIIISTVHVYFSLYLFVSLILISPSASQTQCLCSLLNVTATLFCSAVSSVHDILIIRVFWLNSRSSVEVLHIYLMMFLFCAIYKEASSTQMEFD